MKSFSITTFLLLSALLHGGNFEEGIKALKNQDYKSAHSFFLKDAEHGDASSQYNLGSMYANGQGVKQNYDKAVFWYKKASDKGMPDAQFQMAMMYLNGTGVEKNFTQMNMLLCKAAKAGNIDAQYNLAASFYFGKDIEKNLKISYALFSLAEQNGHIKAKDKKDNLLLISSKEKMDAVNLMKNPKKLWELVELNIYGI